MKIFILTLVLIFVAASNGSSQTTPVCFHKKLTNLNKYGTLSGTTEEKKDCGFTDNEYAYRKIEALMKLAGLPMNFTVCKAERIENAYATVDSTGTRFIVYDDDFLRKLDADSSRMQSITVLAHEIGHHLSAHTLFINDENFQNSYDKYCKKVSTEYDEKVCKEQHLKYLRLGRDQELEADKFAGFIMLKYGASLEQVLDMYNKITNDEDDSESTHPSLTKRLDAVKVGYELAAMKAKSNIHKIDLQEIKGSKIDFEIDNFSRIERNRLISKIKIAAMQDAKRYVDESSKYDFTYWQNSVSYKYRDKIIEYHGHKDNYILIDQDNEYFELLTDGMRLADDPRVLFEPVAAVHLKNNILKLLIFTAPEIPKIVYSAPFSENQVSLEEIKTIFIEIFRKGIQKEIDKFY